MKRARALYVLWAAACTLVSARAFYGSMMLQTGGDWSAPLDDVFIHFDYARAAAEGHPFEWFSGNGYSSGNTSLLYPFVLAAGYLVGFTGTLLMKWAAIVAMTSTFGMLLAARAVVASALGEPAARWRSFLLPPMVLAVGALDWSLWSGMEVAFLLGVWALGAWALVLVDDARDERERARLGWLLGAVGLVLVVTRPEAATTIAGFGVAAAIHPRLSLRARVATLLRTGAPAALALAVQSIANRALTGEASASGAIVKLAINNPFMSQADKVADYVQNLRYAVFRNLEYHFTDWVFVDCIVPVLALLALAMPETRRWAAVLLWQVVSWMLVVALNGQVRWQNERYTMPAVAWLLVCAGLGACALFRQRARVSLPWAAFAVAVGAQILAIAFRPPNTIPVLRMSWVLALACGAGVWLLLRPWVVRAPLVVAALLVASDHEVAKVRDQKWFFGRACRNILDQHLRAGELLAALKPHRILVGDAGALVYASGRPGLDIIGLGGYHDLPFARAGVNGLAASIELVERMPEEDRPDVLAIYPSWWGVLPTWFASDVIARVPAPGNVICGGYEDVLYKADWHVLGTGESPRAAIGSVRDAVDLADLVSEREHGYSVSTGSGWTDMKILPNPTDPRRDLFDGGRILYANATMRFVLRGLTPHRAATLLVRTAPTGDTRFTVYVNGPRADGAVLRPRDGWEEIRLSVIPDLVQPTLDVVLENHGPGELPVFHVWVGQSP